MSRLTLVPVKLLNHAGTSTPPLVTVWRSITEAVRATATISETTTIASLSAQEVAILNIHSVSSSDSFLYLVC